MYSITVFAFLCAVVVCLCVGGWLVLRHDPSGPAFAFGCFMLLMGFWSATHVGTLSTTTEGWHLLFTQLSYVSVVLAPVVWVVLALRYRDRGDLVTGRRLALLCVVPAMTLLAVFTTRYHGLFYAHVEMATVAGRPLLTTESGLLHSVNVVYSYSLLLVGTGLLVRTALQDNRLYRRQSAVLLACSVLPWLVNAAYHVGIRPIPWVDPTPLAFTLVGIPLAGVVVRTNLSSYLPVAHERVFRTLEDPIVVVTPAGRVVDSNEAAREVLRDGGSLEGSSVVDVLPSTLLDGDAPRADLDGAVECTIAVGGESREFLARRRDIDPGPDGPSRGYLVSLTDITVQKTQQRALERKTGRLEAQTARLERANEQLERLADIVSHDLEGPLSTARKLRSILEADLEDPDPSVRQSLDDLASVQRRLRAFADHLPKLARESTDVRTTEECDLSDVAQSAWRVLDTDEAELTIADSRTLRADRRRLQQVFENLFRNALEHGSPPPDGETPGPARGATDGGRQDVGAARGASGDGPRDADDPVTDGEDAADARDEDAATRVEVEATDRGFYVADGGPGIPTSMREQVFEYGVSTGDGSGFGLAIVRTIVEAHGWSVSVTGSDRDGARFEIRTET